MLTQPVRCIRTEANLPKIRSFGEQSIKSRDVKAIGPLGTCCICAEVDGMLTTGLQISSSSYSPQPPLLRIFFSNGHFSSPCRPPPHFILPRLLLCRLL